MSAVNGEGIRPEISFWETLSLSRLIGMAVGIGVSLIGLALFFSGRLDPYWERWALFRIRAVEFQTEWPLVGNQVRAWLPSLEGHSLLAVRPKELVQALTNRPWVQNVSIKKEYPDRLLVTIETKHPQAITLIDGKPHFIDAEGQIIERVTTPVLRSLDLPFLTLENDSRTWNLKEFLVTLDKLKGRLGSKYSISQVVLGTYPYFKFFLASPRVEVVLTFENWEDQWPILERLLRRQPASTGQLFRINLLFPKKAVVSTSLSK